NVVGDHLYLHSFPTRRSSDLLEVPEARDLHLVAPLEGLLERVEHELHDLRGLLLGEAHRLVDPLDDVGLGHAVLRSEVRLSPESSLNPGPRSFAICPAGCQPCVFIREFLQARRLAPSRSCPRSTIRWWASVTSASWRVRSGER